MYNFPNEIESEWNQNIDLRKYEPFLENIQDITLNNEQKKSIYWRFLRRIR